MPVQTDTSADPIGSEYAMIGGHRIRYAESRLPGAPSVILLSPHPQSIRVYEQWWDTITGEFDVVAVDIPNHGLSESVDEITTVSEHAAFLSLILDHFGLDQPHYIGPDVGTPLGLRFMADNPGRLKSAVIGDAGCVGPVTGSFMFRWLVYKPWFRRMTVMSGGLGYSLIAARIGYRNYKPPKVSVREYRKSVAARRRLRNATAFLGSYPHETLQLESDVRQIETPILVLHGEFDTFVAADNSQRLDDLLPNSEFQLVPEAAHYSYEDNAPAYMTAALDHIRTVEAAG